MELRILLLLLVSILFGCEHFRSPQYWPQFRGPSGQGQVEGEAPPLEFGPEKNLLWGTPVPLGHSSPCIWNEHLFLTAFSEGQLKTLAIERSSGAILWEKSVKPSKLETGGSRLGNPATSTPATDGKAVYVYFGAFGLLAYDFQGNEIWRKELPTPITQHGASTSPIVADGRVILVCDQDVDSYLLAVNSQNGEFAWKTPRPHARRGFSTPLAYPLDQPREVIVAGSLSLISYDIADGEVLWEARGLPNEMVSSPVTYKDVIFAAGWTYGSGVERMPDFDGLVAEGDKDADGGLTQDEAPPGPLKRHFKYLDANKDGITTKEEYEGLAHILDSSKNALIAVKTGGRGDVTSSHVRWTQDRGLPYIPSPLVFEGGIFLVKRGGIATYYDLETGEARMEESRVGAGGNYYASPISAGNKILVVSQKGIATWLRPNEKIEIIKANDLGETIFATPAIVDGVIYIRSESSISAYGNKS